MMLSENKDRKVHIQLAGEYERLPIPKVRKVGEWLDASDFSPLDVSNERLNCYCSEGTYPAGWHIYHSEAVAMGKANAYVDGVVVRVSVSNPLAVGYEDCYGNHQCRVTVAKHIKITSIIQ